MRLYGFINVFKLKPTFLQPVFWDNKLEKAYFQHSENKMTISSFELADLDFYIKNADFITYPETDVIVQTGSTVVFAINMGKYIFWGDYLDTLNIIKIFIENKKYFSDFPGFYNTCMQFFEIYNDKVLPDIKIAEKIENRIIKYLFDFCKYDIDRTDFVDIYFQNKEISKLWTIDIIKDLIFSMVRIRKTERYIYSLLYNHWGVDLSQPLTPFKNELSFSVDLNSSDVDSIIENMIDYNKTDRLFILDFLKINSGYVLVAENYLTKEKWFIATYSINEQRIYKLIFVLINELLVHRSEKLYLIINDQIIENNTACRKFFARNSDKIKIVEFPAGYKLQKRFKL